MRPTATSRRVAGTSTCARRDLEIARASSRRRERDLVALAVLLTLPVLTYVLGRSGMSRLEAIGIAGFVVVLLVAWRRGAASGDSERVARWASGAWGEEATAAALDGLARRGFAVLHDVEVPGRRENLDHVVVSRGGVAVIETKRWAGRVVIGRNVRVDGKRRNEVLAQVERQRRAVRAMAGRGVPVDAFVCVHARRVRPAWFRRRAVIDGVTFGGPDELVRWLRRRRRRAALDGASVRALAGRLDRPGLESLASR